MPKHLTQYELGLIKAYRWPKPTLSFDKIAKKLKRKKSTISSAYYRISNRKSHIRKQGSGRRRSTTKFQDDQIILKVKRNNKITSKNIKKELNLKLDSSNIRRRLNKSGFRSCVYNFETIYF